MFQEKKDYNSYSRQNRRNNTRQDTIKQPKESVEIETRLTSGTVSGCSYLNVRKEPNITSEVVAILDKGDTVNIDLTKSTNEFYAVDGGYCIKKYIIIKQ